MQTLIIAFDLLSSSHLSLLVGEHSRIDEIVVANSAAELQIVLAQDFELIVVDTRNISNGRAIIESVRRHVEAGCRVAVITIDDHLGKLKWLLECQAALGVPHGIIPANISPERCSAALQHVAGGGEYINWALPTSDDVGGLEDARLASPFRPGVSEVASMLTPREAQVLLLLKQGLRTKEVAGRLSISVNTAKIHIASIKRKHRVSSIIQIV